MIPRTRLAVLVLLSLLAVALWWVGIPTPSVGPTPDYTVLNRLPDLAGDVADVLIPSVSRGDADREEVFRAVARTERLTTAFFFSTEAALSAHQAFLPSPDQLRHLATGFLGQVRDGMFTAGEDVYPN